MQEIIRLRSEIELLRNRDQAPVVLRQAQGQLLTLKEVCEQLRVSRSTVYRWISEGTFPAPLRIGDRAVRWQSDQIANWRKISGSKES